MIDAVDANAPWFRCVYARPHARRRLFCIPSAGRGAAMYAAWPPAVADRSIEIHAIQSPGREARIHEPPCDDLATMVGLLGEAIAPLLDRPYAFFGHSFGAFVAFALARHLCDRGCVPPAHLFCAGAMAPHLPSRAPVLHRIQPNEAFLRAVQTTYGGIPDVVIDNHELGSVVARALRADLRMAESARPAPSALPVDVTAYGGTRDRWVSKEDLSAWSAYSSRRFSCSMFEGDHFFVDVVRQELLEDIMRRLDAYL